MKTLHFAGALSCALWLAAVPSAALAGPPSNVAEGGKGIRARLAEAAKCCCHAAYSKLSLEDNGESGKLIFKKAKEPESPAEPAD